MAVARGRAGEASRRSRVSPGPTARPHSSPPHTLLPPSHLPKNQALLLPPSPLLPPPPPSATTTAAAPQHRQSKKRAGGKEKEIRVCLWGEMMQPPPPPLDRELLASTPSFRKSPDEWPRLEEITGGVDALALDEVVVEAEEDDGSEEFEFSVFSGDPSLEGVEPISADEIFSNGRILPIYPLFNRALLGGEVGSEGKTHEEERDRGAGEREGAEKTARVPLGKLLMEDRDAPSTSSSESDELEGIPADSYCLWTPSSAPPSPDLRTRSHSTGNSSSKRWRLRDLVIGRSHSDGRKRFLFLAPPHPPSAAADTVEKADRRPSMDVPPLPPSAAEGEKKKGKSRVRVLELDIVTAHRLYYGKGGAAASGDRHRSYLPYRKDLVGFFGNVNGAARSSHHPL